MSTHLNTCQNACDLCLLYSDARETCNSRVQHVLRKMPRETRHSGPRVWHVTCRVRSHIALHGHGWAPPHWAHGVRLTVLRNPKQLQWENTKTKYKTKLIKTFTYCVFINLLTHTYIYIYIYKCKFTYIYIYIKKVIYKENSRYI